MSTHLTSDAARALQRRSAQVRGVRANDRKIAELAERWPAFTPEQVERIRALVAGGGAK